MYTDRNDPNLTTVSKVFLSSVVGFGMVIVSIKGLEYFLQWQSTHSKFKLIILEVNHLFFIKTKCGKDKQCIQKSLWIIIRL